MINLLPEPWRQAQQQEQRFRLLFIWGITLSAFFISLGLFLGMMRLYLGLELVAQQISFVDLEKRVVQEDVLLEELKTWNTTLGELDKRKKDEQSVTEILRELKTTMPQELSLVSFSYTPATTQKKEGETIRDPAAISVTGKAPTRELLFSFRERLQQHELFGEVDFPPQNWVLPKDIDFSFKASIRE